MTGNKIWIGLGFALALLAACGDDDRSTDAGMADGAADADTPPDCASGTTLCGDTCVDTQNHPAHCGGCDMACDVGEACVEATCGLVCPGGQEICDGACIDTQTDRNHCGSCGTACGDGEICTDGTCEISCPGGQTVCGSACTDTQSDPANCGGCGTACDAGQVCSEGSCAASCGAGLTECGGACVDLDNSPTHCGACDNACTAGTAASGVCSAGTCRAVCDVLNADCNGDIGTAGGDGCETPVGTDPQNCGACGRTCSFPDAVAGCSVGACTIATCVSGFGDCDGVLANGCETPVLDDEFNCGACGTVCGSSEECIDGSCFPIIGEDCSSAGTLALGTNTITWTALNQDYLTATTPACRPDFADLVGPDLVFSYTAASDGEHTFTLSPPSSTRWVAMLSTAACGTLTPEIDCDSEYGSSIVTAAYLTTGQTVYLYVSDTDSGSNPLDNPLTIDVGGPSCAAPTAPTVTTLSPASGTETDTTEPVFVVDFSAPVHEFAGVVTLTGDMGTSLSYDLSTLPAEVSFNADGDQMTIDPTAAFAQGEQITISWTGLIGRACGQAVTPPTWVVDILDCSTRSAPSATTLSPPNGATTSSLSPTFSVTFDGPIATNVGTVTITGDMSTSLTYDLASSPVAVSFSSGDTVMEISPGALPAGETLTISWSGLQGVVCGLSVASPTWTVTNFTPPCTPGMGGVVGTTTARVSSGIPTSTSFSEYYVVPDGSPTGYVYVGGTSDLYRLPKAGGTAENVGAAAGLTSSHLGYDMIIVGSEIYTLQNSTSGTSGHLWRISTDGGASWTLEDYASFPVAPGDDLRGLASYGGRIYMVTDESSTGDTEVWSVPVGETTLPVMATLELTFTGWSYCTGMARDVSYFYFACYSSDETIRIPVGGGTATVITDIFDNNISKNALAGDDLDGDDVFDVLYHHGYYEEVNYICDPAGSPYPSQLVDQGGSSSNYGMGFDPAVPALWTFDDDTYEFIRTE